MSKNGTKKTKNPAASSWPQLAALKLDSKQGMSDRLARPVSPYRVQPHSSAFTPGVDTGRLNQLVDELESAEFAVTCF